MDDILEGLNPEQLDAVTSTEGYIRVIASAGSGKTRALTRRFAYLVLELGIRPGNILCVTFTNKAANEMRQRIRRMTGDSDTGFVVTFHGFCVRVLQEESYAVQYPKSFLVLDNADIDAMLEIIYEERGLSLRDKTYSDARDMFEMRKGKYEPRYFLNMIQMSLEELHQKYMEAETIDDILFYGYLYQEKKCFGLDYNDLIRFTLYIFETHEDIKIKWQKRLEYIMIDEFQDIDPLQYELMDAICRYHNNLFIVGDPDQTIYTWRGANVRFLVEFDKHYPDVHTIMMNRNYRSQAGILESADTLIARNKLRIEKRMIPVITESVKPVYFHAKTSKDEAEWIETTIRSLHDQGVSFRDIAILYRAHYVSRNLEEVFIRKQLPYRIYSGIQFYERMEIRDAVAYLRMIAYKDDLSFLRIVNKPRRNIGKRRIAYLKEYSDAHGCTLYEALQLCADEELFRSTQTHSFINLVESFNASYSGRPVSQVLAEILDKSGYEKMLRTQGAQERLDELAELKQSVFEFEASCGEETDLITWLNLIALFTRQDMPEGPEEVRLMTIHTAKGLEFPYVFLCGMSEGIFPSRRADSLTAMEEERRLAYVAVTRSERMLYISDGEGRNFDMTDRYPSRFVLEMKDTLDFVNELPESLLKNASAYISDQEAGLAEAADFPFTIGDRVAHPVFGEGTIESIDPKEGVIMVKFDRLNTSRGIAWRAAKKLKVL